MMKVPNSVRTIYIEQVAKYEQLKQRVDQIVGIRKSPRWHYESRIKSAEGFALKAETGRCPDLNAMEDFLACTLVVENLASVRKAEQLVRKLFTFREKRPPQASFTSKPSNAFPFDDLRIYVEWADDPSLPPSGLHGCRFEVQIKTYLQHAWAIATHDLVYKGKDKVWAKERIAYQVKAMLEHAEVSIQEATKLAKSRSLNKTDKACRRASDVIHLLSDLWPPEFLPDDRVRVAENIDDFIRNVGISVARLREVLDLETNSGRGTKTLNLSPYGVIVQSVAKHEATRFREYLTRDSTEFKVLLCPEIDVPFEADEDMAGAILVR